MRGITILELLRVKTPKWRFPRIGGGGWAWGGGGGAGASRKCGGITVLELLRLENAKTVIQAKIRGNHRFGAFEALKTPKRCSWGAGGLGQAENAGESPF